VLFILHGKLHWEAWFVAAIGLTALIFFAPKIELEEPFAEVELSLLMFFISLFIIVGGVEHSKFLEYIGQGILRFIQQDLLTACLVLLWASVVFSAAIDNIPFTAAMIPIILGLKTHGINVTPWWWALAVGVGMSGYGTHLGATANVFIVTISERLARQAGEKRFQIAPGIWFKKGTPVMIIALVVSSTIFWTFFDFYATPLPNSVYALQ